MNKIEERKSTKRIQFLDKNGKPLTNAKIEYNLINHKFLFGCGGFEFLKLFNDKENKSNWKERTDIWLNLFNYATLPFYWGGFEKEEGKPDTDTLMKAAKYLKEKNVTVKGHPLCWHTGCVPWLMNYDNPTILKKQIERIHREVSEFKGIIDIWDVINEVVIMPVYDKYDNAITRICKDLGRVGICKEVFAAAKRCNQTGTFLINDFNLSQSYEILIDGCLNAGVPINTIGLQTHQHHGVLGKEKIEEILSRFEHFGLPIHFTENTIVAGPTVDPKIIDLQDAHYEDDAATPEYEAFQAEELTKMYKLLFEEHPLVTAISNWDFGDGAWLNAPSGVIRRDNSLKPSYIALDNLIHKEWNSSGNITTDNYGFAEISGFKGDYKATLPDGNTIQFKID